MPTQSSLAAGVLQTAMRISITIGLAITAGVYGTVAQTSGGKADVNQPFERAYLCSIIFAAISLVIIPFMKIGRQGKKLSLPISADTPMVEEERPRTGGEYSDRPSTGTFRHMVVNKPSQTSLWSYATAGSVDSFFPRWSWEPEIAWPDDRYQCQSSNVVYEVCVKCLEERVAVVQPKPGDGGHRPQTLDSNPFRRIEEDFYDVPVPPPADVSLNPNEGVYTKCEAGTSSFDSTETLIPTTRGNSQQTASRELSRGGPSSGDATIIRHGIEGHSLGSTDTLRPHTARERGSLLINTLSLPSFPTPPQRTSTLPIPDTEPRMSGARMGLESASIRSPSSPQDSMARISRGAGGGV